MRIQRDDAFQNPYTSPTMICVRLEGGLGNQLFQYAAGRALSQRHNTTLLLDTTALIKPDRRVTPRDYELHHFQTKAWIAEPGQVRHCDRLRRFPAFASMMTRWRFYAEPRHADPAAFHALPDNTYLCGYWQSHHYLKGIEKNLLEEFEPSRELSPESIKMLHQIKQENAIAVHVRRGDYITLASAAKYHGTLSSNYYTAAFEVLKKHTSKPFFFVFSDDPAWCASNLPLQHNQACFLAHNTGADAWQDLVLMSHCRHHLIANSSFSWWGAWLADQRWSGTQRLVIAPANWFSGKQDQTLADRFPAHWRAFS